MTLRQMVSLVQQKLASVEDLEPMAARDAALLVLGTLHLPRTLLYTHPARLLSAPEQEQVAEALRRRLTGEPMQYILGTQEFFGLALAVTPAVLIPRPETEQLVEAAIRRLPLGRSLWLADVGTGSGAIAIALAVQFQNARIVAIDLSAAALGVAEQNALTHGVANRITFCAGDLLEGLPRSTPPLDVVLANPPYIPRSDGPGLHRQVRDFEPHLALFAPESSRSLERAGTHALALPPDPPDPDDGLSLYRRLVPQSWAALRPGGLLVMEFGAEQQEVLRELLRDWVAVQFLSDLQGIPRIALARTPEALP